MLNLNTAYAGTGKDALYAILASGGSVVDLASDVKTTTILKPWLVYAPEGASKPNYGDVKTLQRVAFADAVKKECFASTGLPGTYQDYEKVKDTFILSSGKTLRQHYIDYCVERRSKDDECFVKSALEKFVGCKEVNLFATDLRFKVELAYQASLMKHFKTSTTRLYRSEVKVADKSVVSEHEMDELCTDYLLVQSEDEFTKAVKIWPQYAAFKPQWKIVPST